MSDQNRNLLILFVFCIVSISVNAWESNPTVQKVLRLEPGPGNPRNSEGDFIRLKDGRILFVYTRFTGGDSDHARADLVSRESTDGGLTWSDKDQMVVSNEGDWNIMSVSLCRLQNGKIALFYLRKNSLKDCRPVMRLSEDEAKTWGKPVDCITDELGYYVLNNNRVIQLTSGRIVVPVAQHTKADGKWNAGVVHCYLSDDNGATWRRNRERVQAEKNGSPVDLMEPGVVELGNGQLLMVLRTRVGSQFLCRSQDGGETWTLPQPSPLFSPESPATIVRIPSTDVLLSVWNDHRDKPESFRCARPPVRTPLSYAISRDDGATWNEGGPIESDPDSGYCYTAIEFTNHRILLAYCAHKSRWGLATTQISALDLGSVLASGSARWGGSVSPNRVSTARNLPENPSQSRPLWELKLGTHQYSIPTIDRGRMYIAVDDAGISRPGYEQTGGGVLKCIDQATGKLIWQFITPRYFEGVNPPYHFDQWRAGICSGALVDDNRVYVVGSRGEIICLDREGQANGNDGPFKDELDYMEITKTPENELCPTDGDIIWKFNLIKELDVVPHDVCGSTLLLLGDHIYVCTSNGIDDRHDKIPRPQAASLVVLDKFTGRLVAKDGEKIGERMLHCNWSSPSCGEVDGKMMIFFGGGDGILYAFEPPKSATTGVQILKKIWSYDCNPPDFRFRDGKPVDYSKHNKNSPEGPSEIISTPVFHQGRIYVAIGQSPIHGNGRGCLSCVDAATGKKIWASELVERSLATVSVTDGLLFIPDTTGNLHCFNADTGQRYWKHPLGSKTWCASTLVADGKVYIGTEAGVLWVLKASKDLQVLSKTQWKTMLSTLTADDGVLYIPTQRALSAIPGPSTSNVIP